MADIEILGTLHSAAEGNTVARADEILDATKGKKQSVINQETDTAIAGVEAAIKSEQERALAVEDELQEMYETIHANDIIVGPLPSSGQEKKIYRVPGTVGLVHLSPTGTAQATIKDNGDVTSSSTTSYHVYTYDVSDYAGETVFITGTNPGSNNYVLAAWYDSNGDTLSVVKDPSGGASRDYSVQVPSDAVTLKVYGSSAAGSGNVLPAVRAYDDGVGTSYSDYMWYNDEWVKMATFTVANEPLLVGLYTCDTEDDTAAKTVNATGFQLPTSGGAIKLKMTNVNSVNNATLEINGTGAKALYYDDERASSTNSWEAGEVVEVYYDDDSDAYYANNVAGGGKFSNGEKVKEVGIDGVPIAGSDNLVRSGGVSKYLQHHKLDGNDNNSVEIGLAGLIPGKIYSVVLKTDWTVEETSGNSTKVFWVRDTQTGDFLVSVTKNKFDKIQNLYTFTVPEDCVNIGIGGRADAGTAIAFAVVDSEFVITMATQSLYLYNKNSPSFVRTITNATTMSVEVTFPVKFKILDTKGVDIVEYTDTETYAEASFTVSNYKCLSWDLSTKTLSVIDYTETNKDTYIPILGVLGTSVFGLAKPYYDRWIEKTVNDSMAALDTEVRKVDSKVGDPLTAPLNIKQGTISSGAITTSKVCLYSDVFVKVKPSSTISCIVADDITIRISEYSAPDTAQANRTGNSGTYTRFNTYTVGENTNYVLISANYTDRGFSDENQVSVNDYQEGDFAIFDSFKSAIDRINDALSNQDGYDLPARLSNSRFVEKSNSSGALSLLHFSDIHGNTDNLKRIVKFMQDYSGYLDGALCTGDMVADKFADDLIFDDEVVPGSEDIMLCVGNHDVAKHETDSSYEWFFYAKTQAAYEQYMANVAEWDVTQPSGAGQNNYYPCYYYKDFTTKGVRLIVLDMMAWGKDILDSVPDAQNAQYNWLQSVLDDARTNNRHVVIAEHFPFWAATKGTRTKNADALESDFTLPNRFASFISSYDDYIGGSALPTISDMVEAFKQAGGVFVCYICGHTHFDNLLKVTANGQMMVVISTASASSDKNNIRDVNDASMDCFNVFSVDTTHRIVKVFRVGSHLTSALQKIDTMHFVY